MKKRANPSVITIDIYNNSYYKHSNNKVTKLTKLKKNKKDIAVSYVANKDLIIELIELSSSIPEQDVKDIITNKVYDELRLDTAIEYDVYPIKTHFRSKVVKYQTIIVDKNALKEKFKKVAKAIKNLDYLIPAPLLYKVLYAQKLLSSDSADMFIYFGDYDTFVTFYYKGEYLYSKSIKFSLDNMYDRFCQLAQEVPMTKEQFREVLANNGLKSEDNTHRELIIRVINECFLNINDILIYVKRTYDISSIKNTYVGFSWGYLDGIEVYTRNYLNVESKPIVSIYSKEDPKSALDPLHTLMKRSALALEDASLDLPNLTPYPRPLPLFKRPAGSIILAFLAIVALFMLPIIYDYLVGLSFKGKNIILEEKERKLTAEANRYKRLLKQKREELKALDLAIDKTSKIYNSKKSELEKVYNKKVNYSLRSEQITLITDVLKEYDIVSKDIRIDGNTYYIDLEATSEKQITEFIKAMVRKFNKQIEDIGVNEIIYDKKEKIYKAVLHVTFKEGIR